MCSGDRAAESGAESGTPPSRFPLTQNPYPTGFSPRIPYETLGTFSNHGITSTQGKSIVKTNQDCGSVSYPFLGDHQKLLLCCFDGHGNDGHLVSKFAVDGVVGAVDAGLRGLGDEKNSGGCMPCKPVKERPVSEVKSTLSHFYRNSHKPSQTPTQQHCVPGHEGCIHQH